MSADPAPFTLHYRPATLTQDALLAGFGLVFSAAWLIALHDRPFILVFPLILFCGALWLCWRVLSKWGYRLQCGDKVWQEQRFLLGTRNLDTNAISALHVLHLGGPQAKQAMRGTFLVRILLAGQQLAFDSRAEHFDEILNAALDHARAANLNLTDVTRSNLLALGISSHLDD